MKDLFINSYEKYKNHMEKNIENYYEHDGHLNRREQCENFIEAINENFNFDKLITLETGASQNYFDGLWGLFLGFATTQTNGKMFSVDINENYTNKSLEIFKKTIPDLNYNVIVGDSVSCLENLEDIPNLVHLDSWDFNPFDPLPCALHGWKEFKAIESKMISGSIIIIDDNWKKGCCIFWNHSDGRQEKVDIVYPMIGKGAHIYQEVISNKTDWKLIGSHYETCMPHKIIIQKK